MFKKVILTIIFIITVYSAISYFMSVPLIRDSVYEIEAHSAKMMLDNIYKLIEVEYLSIEAYRTITMDGYKEQLKNIIQIVESAVENKYARYKSGFLTKEVAKKEVLDEINGFFYGNRHFVWVSDYHSVLLANPDPKYRNLDCSNLKNRQGDYFIRRFVKQAREQGEGYSTHWWYEGRGQKRDIEKLVYMKDYPKWKFVIGTSFYIDDLRFEVERRKTAMIQELRKVLNEIKIGQTGYFFIFDSNLNMIIHPDPNLEGTNFTSLKNPISGQPIGKELIDASNTSEQILHYKWDMPEKKGFYSYDRVAWTKYYKNFDWYITCSAYTNEFIRSSIILQNNIIYLTFAALVISAFIALFFARMITTPVKKLSDMAIKVKNGDLSAHSDVKSKDEIGLLTATMNSMVAKIKVSMHQLDTIIKTSQLISAKLEINELLEAILTKTMEITGAERGIQVSYQYGEETVQTEYKLKNISQDNKNLYENNMIINRVKINKKGLVITNKITEEKDILDYLEEQSIRSIICIPLITEEKLLGILYLDSRLKDNLFSEEELNLLEIFAAQAAISIDKAQTYKALAKERDNLDEKVKERTREIASIIENAPTAIQKIARDGTVVLVNPAFEKILGIESKKILGKNIFAYKSISNSILGPAYKKVLSTGQSILIENFPININKFTGEKRYLTIIAAPNKDEKSKVIDSLLVMFNDNTAKAIAEQTLKEDLNIAKEIQKDVIFKDYKDITDLNIKIYFKPMIEVGGDLYDIHKVTNKYYRFFIADATGHGVQAALTTMLIKSEYDKIKIFNIDPDKLLKILNKTFFENYKIKNFFSCMVMDIDLNRNKILYSSAGHPNQYLISDNNMIDLHVKGKTIGFLKDIEYLSKEIAIKKGDKILLFTDGLIEDVSATGEELDEERVKKIILNYIHLPINEIINNVTKDIIAWRGEKAAEDDVTFIGISY